MKHDFLEHQPGHAVCLNLLQKDWALPLSLEVRLLEYRKSMGHPDHTFMPEHRWWEFRLFCGYRLLCELRTYNHRFAVPLLVEILNDEFRGSEDLLPALASLHEVFGNQRALEDLCGEKDDGRISPETGLFNPYVRR